MFCVVSGGKRLIRLQDNLTFLQSLNLVCKTYHGLFTIFKLGSCYLHLVLIFSWSLRYDRETYIVLKVNLARGSGLMILIYTIAEFFTYCTIISNP